VLLCQNDDPVLRLLCIHLHQQEEANKVDRQAEEEDKAKMAAAVWNFDGHPRRFREILSRRKKKKGVNLRGFVAAAFASTLLSSKLVTKHDFLYTYSSLAMNRISLTRLERKGDKVSWGASHKTILLPYSHQ
jgi:hypothetical protein